ncbi:histidinol-phosphate transaminase [Wielerella bovis]|uniref:histidinol-phosphate transaminase n=1 Tax=Wielerella bovis TaxID=2917790 RepID=UPI002019CF2D|nr:histidinol-phosphate transaminase [Wielerella bovis]MCG7656924.1 histidinol-phosphate transaminase [Wielerella bovis]MCG7659147.1 histidinol-phosphate transaminase [Wielerella bovis]
MSTHFIRPDILAQSAYQVADVPADFIKLDAMEVPYTFPEELQKQLAEQLVNTPINRYPNIASSGIQAALRQTFHIPETTAIALGNGSDELIQFLTLLVAQPNAVMLALEPSFVMYRRNAELFGMQYVGIPLTPDFSLNKQAVLDAIAQHNPAIIFIAYPNNPTGVPFIRSDIEEIIQAASGLVVIDEAYGAFSEDSFIAQAGQPENLIIMRTLSKIGFAGLRLGYAVGSPIVLNELTKILPPYNINQLSLTAAKFALQHFDIIEKNIETLKDERQHLFTELALLDDVTVYPSQANFLTIKVPDAQYAFNKLKENKILVKNLHHAHPFLANCLRLTIGTPIENAHVLRVLRDVIAEHNQQKHRGLMAITQKVNNQKLMRNILITLAIFLLFSIFVGVVYFSTINP